MHYVKAQSAIEYLITYGWAVVIIAVVLGALFYFGVFSGNFFIQNTCIANSGFLCKNVTLTTSGLLSFEIGQSGSASMNDAHIYFVPEGANFSASYPNASVGNLNQGQIVRASIQLSSSPSISYIMGESVPGYLYIRFKSSNGITETLKVGRVLAKVDIYDTETTTSSTISSTTTIPGTLNAPQYVNYYVPITLQNLQSNTPAPFQQMLQIQEGRFAQYISYNGTSANFEFFYFNGTIIPAWIESNDSSTLTIWLKLGDGINANSNEYVYLGFANKTTNLLSSSGATGIGEAPQLSSTYAEYDDGAAV
ncbi:MAG: hypothetical protein ACP5RP_04535, partial [Candidatus Micrarchaeia archaeon]